eukprot:scaffold129603_cov34-Cyclotella_meneghiniana.AAC.1
MLLCFSECWGCTCLFDDPNGTIVLNNTIQQLYDPEPIGVIYGGTGPIVSTEIDNTYLNTCYKYTAPLTPAPTDQPISAPTRKPIATTSAPTRKPTDAGSKSSKRESRHLKKPAPSPRRMPREVEEIKNGGKGGDISVLFEFLVRLHEENNNESLNLPCHLEHPSTYPRSFVGWLEIPKYLQRVHEKYDGTPVLFATGSSEIYSRFNQRHVDKLAALNR